MKRFLAIAITAAVLVTAFSGCSLFTINVEPTKPSETAAETTQAETSKPAETTEATQKVNTTDEFPTEGDDAENVFTEPNGRWKVTIPDVWYKYGEIKQSAKKNYVKFVYKKASDEYGAGHVFTISTVDAADAVDVKQFPHAEEIYKDENIQIYVEYPTDVQFGGMDGSSIESDGPEYQALSETKDEIIDSLEVLE